MTTAVQTIGDYELLEKIAEGGMGAIYKGRPKSGGEVVAIKVMPAHLAINKVLLQRFEQEFRVAGKLNHPNIVRALDYNNSKGTPYLVMEFVEGESLGQKIHRDGPMAELEAIRIIAQVAQGLHRAHKLNLVHRDVKPDNILLTAEGTAKLADLGLVKETENDLNLTRTGRGLGTPHFMAPEQFRNAKNADARCDIYSLAATLYMMVTGKLPFDSSGPLDAWMKKIQNDLPSPRSLVPSLSERCEWAILRGMHPEPDMRPNSCREFIEDLTGHSTRRVAIVNLAEPSQELWFLVYRDENNTPHTAKGATQAIRRSLRDGLLGDAGNIRAARSKSGPFEPLRNYPEFRDLVVDLTCTPSPVVQPGKASGSNTPVAPSVVVSPQTSPPLTSGVLPTYAAPAPKIQIPVNQPSSSEGSMEWLKMLFILAAATACGALFAYFFLR